MHKAINEHITAIDDMVGTFYADGRRSFFCVAAEGVHISTIAQGTTEVMLSAVSSSLGDAKTIVNLVRKRYFSASDWTTVQNEPGPGFTAFDKDWMLSEWGKEYLGEGRRRRTDLRRFDKFTQGQWWFFGRATDPGFEMPAKRDRKYELYPIPADAIKVNPGIVQNPGY